MGQYPYQIVSFLDKEPGLGEPVYYGEHGWYPQIALKRRFRLHGISEAALTSTLQQYFAHQRPLHVRTGKLVKPERMPVQVIEIENAAQLVDFHLTLLEELGDTILSRYPERDGANYFPHITAEYGGEMVIQPKYYVEKDFTLSSVWLLKDGDDENSVTIARFGMMKP